MPALFQKCPKCDHERAAGETAPEEVCPACGLIFAKYLQARTAPPAAAQVRREVSPEHESAQVGREVSVPDELTRLARFKSMLVYVPDEVGSVTVYARAALLVALIVYGVKLAAMDVPSWEMMSSLIHMPMVPIHEFGHILFLPFGEFMTLLGGSLFQAGLPLIFGGIFLVRNRDPFAAAVMLWWSAVAVMDIAPYIYDAQLPQHVLLTGRTGDTGAHDFIDVLGDLGLLHKAQTVGYVAHRFGVLMLVASFAWAAWVLRLQFQRRRAVSA